MSWGRRLVVCFVLASGVAAAFKGSERFWAFRRNQGYADFLCSSTQLDVQIGNYRNATEDIANFLSRFAMNQSSHSIHVGGVFYHQRTDTSARTQPFRCNIEGRNDIELVFYLESPHFLDQLMLFLVLGLFLFFVVAGAVLRGLVDRYQAVLGEQLIQRLRGELALAEVEPSAEKHQGVIWSLVRRFIDFDRIKKDVKSLKRTINRLGEQVAKAHVKEALLKQEVERNREFSEKVDLFIHDIKSPLGMIGALEQLSEKEKERSYLAKTKERLNHLLQSLTQTREGLNTGPPVAVSVIELATLVQEIIDEKNLTYPSVAIEFTQSNELADAPLIACPNPKEFHRHLSNVMNNAIEANAQKIEVALLPEGSKICTRVRDWGDGISPQVLKKVTEKGFSHGKTAGTGLGLYTLKAFVESSKGHLRVDSIEGEQTCVEICLPFVSSV
jgi:signal transduction histidine kinase